jgi:hypothetical protein
MGNRSTIEPLPLFQLLGSLTSFLAGWSQAQGPLLWQPLAPQQAVRHGTGADTEPDIRFDDYAATFFESVDT